MEDRKGTVKCPCRWKKCKRYGDCAACIAHHQKSEKRPRTSCGK